VFIWTHFQGILLQISHTERNQQQQDAFSRFMYGIKADETRRKYVSKLEQFFDFYKIEGETIKEKSENFLQYTRKGKDISQKVTDLVLNYMYFHIQRAQKNEIARSTIRNFYKPIKLFCEMNNVILNWKIISKGLPKGVQTANDRIPTIDEILEVLKYPDRRIKPVLYTMISSGIRIGAWEWLKWKNIIPIYDEKKTVIAAKIIVYDGEPDQYFSFITPEAYASLKEWMDFREKQGEKITKESYLMRDLWNTGKILINSKESNLTKGTTGNITLPKKPNSNAIRQIFTRAWKIQNIRPPDNDIRRHEFKSTHCFRKYFETHAMESMKLLNVKMLMGHDTGLEKSYYKPSEKDLLEVYMKVVDELTINEVSKLKLEFEESVQIQKTVMQTMQEQMDKLLQDVAALKKKRK
jgi:integrase